MTNDSFQCIVSRTLIAAPSALDGRNSGAASSMRAGVDTFWLDFDIFLLRDPTQHVLDIAHRRGVDLLVSGSFADDCICSGLVFFRATQTVVDWLLIVLSLAIPGRAWASWVHPLSVRTLRCSISTPDRGVCGFLQFRLRFVQLGTNPVGVARICPSPGRFRPNFDRIRSSAGSR